MGQITEIYLSSDRNNLDTNTRRNMMSSDNEVNWDRLFKVGWLILGMIIGSALHDSLFHQIEQVMR